MEIFEDFFFFNVKDRRCTKVWKRRLNSQTKIHHNNFIIAVTLNDLLLTNNSFDHTSMEIPYSDILRCNVIVNFLILSRCLINRSIDLTKFNFHLAEISISSAIFMRTIG